MPELRAGVRRGRAQANPVVQAERSSTRRRRAARNQQSVDQNPPATRSPERRAEIGLVEGRGEVGGLGGEEKLEEVGEKKMNDCDSGARSPDKLPGGEDETSTAPLPEKRIFADPFVDHPPSYLPLDRGSAAGCLTSQRTHAKGESDGEGKAELASSESTSRTK
ncbi:hypothetical protein BHM03_00003377 [Ensete ventricosum]|nr:hypothetical protein BHM03_00003377 [Ensete ventricosum]